MKVVRILFLVLLVPTLAFAQYNIVLKNGKVIEGKYLHEDQSNIYIESNGIQMNFKKERLDLDKMKELNANMPAPEEMSALKPSPRTTTTPKAPVKKPVRVYTTEDLKQMKEIWDEGKEETAPAAEAAPATEPAPAAEGAPVAQPEVTQTAPVTQPASVTQTAPEAQTMPAENAQQVAPAPEAQSQPVAPVDPPEPVGPRDEKTIRDEIEAVKLQIAETEKRIQELRAKGRVSETWEKLVVKQKQRILDLQQEIKDSIAARKAAKRATQTQNQR